MSASGNRLVVGIPTVAREQAYVHKTVKLLLCRGGTALGDRARIVLMNAHTPPEAHSDVEVIRARHREAVARGALQIVTAPACSMGATDPRRDEAPVAAWQVKQVLDAAALMEYCAPLGLYYLHLEDDIVPGPGWLSRVLDFVEEEERVGGWHALAFYSAMPMEHRAAVELHRFWGHIGVLFRTSDLPSLVADLRRRRFEAPVDHLVIKHLERHGLELRAHVPSLFEHVGFQSSNPARVQSDRAWRWSGDRTPVHRVLRRVARSLHVRFLRWRHGRRLRAKTATQSSRE